MSLPLRIIFDFSCPYCYVAWGSVQKLKEKISMEDEWVGWEIHPDLPKKGRTIQEVIPGIRLDESQQALNELGAPVGLVPGNKQLVPNTRLALQGLEFSRDHGKMQEWVAEVYKASFVLDKNIGEMDILVGIADQIGLDTAAFQQALASDLYLETLLKNDRECMEKQLQWVPTIFVGQEKVFEGAVTYEVFEKTLVALDKP
ncbi:MAG: putative dithiol-disulfide isomerase involved in polyketide biosynthesis [Pelosinus sp.]|nr:putative dithiol-disulfide isomerase involved in polyketide biosynthesis [Pelosinus sp.]